MRERGVLLTRTLNILYLIPVLVVVLLSYPKEVNLFDRTHQRLYTATRISMGDTAKSTLNLSDDDTYLPLEWISAPLSFAAMAGLSNTAFTPNAAPWPWYFIFCGCIFINFVILNGALIKIFGRPDYD